MSDVRHVRWRHDGWHGVMDLAAGLSPGPVLEAARGDVGRRSRHAWTRALDGRLAGFWLKVYPAPGGPRARRAWTMGGALADSGFDVPEAVLVGQRRREGVLVTRDVGGRPLLDVVTSARGETKRDLLRQLGRTVAALHAGGFVHGDLVPSNVLVRDGTLVLLDHDRTRYGRLLVWWGARRNLVQLGRFVVPGLRVTDRVRVLCAYAGRRGLSPRARRRLARWVAAKTIERRIAIDRIPPSTATRAGYAALMRSGGPYDPAIAPPGARR
jgi:hypothetical protein